MNKTREPKPNRKEQVIGFSIDFDTTDQLYRASKMTGKSISAFMNDVLLDHFRNRTQVDVDPFPEEDLAVPDGNY